MAGVTVSSVPPEYPCTDGQTVWLIIGALCVSSPVLLLLLSPLIRQPAADLTEVGQRQHAAAAAGIAAGGTRSGARRPRGYEEEGSVVSGGGGAGARPRAALVEKSGY